MNADRKLALPVFETGVRATEGETRVVASVIYWAFCAYLLTYAVEGPLRYLGSSVGFPNVIYVRDLVALACVVALYAKYLIVDDVVDAALATTAALGVTSFALGLLYSGSVFQTIFGFKVFLSMIFGLGVWPVVRQRARQFAVFVAVIFAISVAGVVLNFALGKFPWEGQAYDTAFGTVLATREWWIVGGIRRLPGFARASFDAAMMIGLSGAVLLTVVRSIWSRVLIGTVAIAIIALTTSKGMMLAFTVVWLWLLCSPGRKGSKFGLAIAGLLLLMTVLLPAVVVLLGVQPAPRDTDLPTFLLSMWERFADMWPRGIGLMRDALSAVTGLGFGSIGMPQKVGLHPEAFNAADSIFIYFYLTFGVLGIAYLAFPMLVSQRVLQREPNLSQAYLALLIITYGYGLSINMMEQSFFAAFLGMVYGAAFGVAGRAEHPEGAL